MKIFFWIALISGLVATIAFFMPWVSELLGITVPAPVTTYSGLSLAIIKENNFTHLPGWPYYFILVNSLISVVLAIIAMIKVPTNRYVSIAFIVLAIVSLSLFILLKYETSQWEMDILTYPGLWLTILGQIGILVAGILGSREQV